MFPHRLVLHSRSLLSRPACTRYIPRHPSPWLNHPQPLSSRPSTSLASRILPPALRSRHDSKKVRKTKPLPLSPSPVPRYRRRLRYLWYALGFIVSGGITYTVLQPDNFANHVFHGVVRNWRVTVALVHCVYDYRMVMRRKYNNEEDRTREMSECHTRCAKRTLKVFEKNGGIYIKLGQHLAALSYLIPIEWVSTMSVLQDACPPTSLEDLSTLYLHDTNHTLSEDFSYFNPTPLGVASLAQVHRATLRDSDREVAVKIQHPEVARYSAIDIVTTRFIFDTIQRWFPEISIGWLGEEMEISLPQELDFQREFDNANTTRAHFAAIQNSLLKIPDMIWAKKRVLVMEYIEGSRVDNLEYLSKHHISPMAVSTALSAIFNEMTFISGHLHCDPHLGNVFIRPANPKTHHGHNFEIVLLDHGLYRQLPRKLRTDYAHLWLSIINNDIPSMCYYSELVANVPPEKFPLFASAITGRDYGRIIKGDETKGIQVPHSIEEVQKIQRGSVGGEIMLELVDLLSNMPRIMLLLLKTNDLTRALDESLHIQSTERNFLLMTRYCAKAVLLDRLSTDGGWGKVSAWFSYIRTLTSLTLYEFWLDFKNRRFRYFFPRMFSYAYEQRTLWHTID